MAPDCISLREYARRRGVTLAAVQKAIASGRVTAIARNGQGRVIGIHEAAANVQWMANTDPVEAGRNGKLAASSPHEAPAPAPSRQPLLELEPSPAPADQPEASPPAKSDQTAYLEHRAKREAFEAKSAELSYLKEVGAVVSAVEMREIAFRRYRTLRDKLLNIPDRVATILAAERDPVMVHKLLTDEIKRILHELSDGARSAAAGGDQERLAA